MGYRTLVTNPMLIMPPSSPSQGLDTPIRQSHPEPFRGEPVQHPGAMMPFAPIPWERPRPLLDQICEAAWLMAMAETIGGGLPGLVCNIRFGESIASCS
jgi:hypothetical protein